MSWQKKIIKLMGVVAEIEQWRSTKGLDRIKIGLAVYLPKLINELRDCEGYKYEGSNVCTVKDTSRNIFTLDVLSNGEFNGQSLNYCNNVVSKPPFTKTFNEIIQEEIKNDVKPGYLQHQIRFIEQYLQKGQVINAGEMGVMKTRPTLKVIQILRKWKIITGSVWWVGPNSGLTSLRTQIDKWSFQGLFIRNDRIMNYHSLESAMSSADQWPQMVVFDEIHALKNSSARRTQLAMTLTENMEKIYGSRTIVIGLTGTPSPQSFFDWWSICEVVRPGYLKEPSFSRYKYRIASFGTGERADGGQYPVFNGWINHKPSIQALKQSTQVPNDPVMDIINTEEKKQKKEKEKFEKCSNPRCEVCSILPKRLEGLVFITWKKDCLDLPEKVYEERILSCSESTKRVAKALSRLGSRGAELQSRLRQLSDGFQYEESGTKEGKTPKDEALIEILEETEEIIPRIVVYAAFTASVDRCVKTCLSKGWTVWHYDGRGQQFLSPNLSEQTGRPEEFTGDFSKLESIFQDTDKYDAKIAFVGNPEAAGQGLTLTPANTIVYFSNSFKSVARTQSEDRIHRPGASKERGCRIIDLIHLPTDKLVLDRIKNKRDAELITLEEIDKTLE